MNPERQAVVDQLTAERYGASVWWSRPVPVEPDTDTSTARRRRQMAADYARLNAAEAVAS